MRTKVCGKCKEEKPLSCYNKHKQKGRKTWVRNVCKDCHNARVRELRRMRNNGKKRKPYPEQFYEVIKGGGYFRGKLPVVGFRETVRAGYFPTGMVVKKGSKRYKIDGKRMVAI